MSPAGVITISPSIRQTRATAWLSSGASWGRHTPGSARRSNGLLERKHRLSLSEYEVLRRLADPSEGHLPDSGARRGGPSQPGSALSRLVKRLEDEGLATRKICDHDRRGIWPARYRRRTEGPGGGASHPPGGDRRDPEQADLLALGPVDELGVDDDAVGIVEPRDDAAVGPAPLILARPIVVPVSLVQ